MDAKERVSAKWRICQKLRHMSTEQFSEHLIFDGDGFSVEQKTSLEAETLAETAAEAAGETAAETAAETPTAGNRSKYREEWS